MITTMTCSSAVESPSKKGAKVQIPDGVPVLKEEQATKQKIPLNISASWVKGELQSSQFDLTSPEGSRVMQTHGPLLLAASSFCQTFLDKAKEQYIEVKDMQAKATSQVDASAFYRKDYDNDARDPWKAIDLQVKVDAEGASHMEIQMLAKQVLNQQCPTKELLEDHFAVAVALTVDTYDKEETPMDLISNYTNLERYNVIAKTNETAVQPQSLTCTYDAEGDYPVFFIDVGDDISFFLSASETVPVGKTPDNLPTPVQAFLFGCLSYYVECFVMRLGVRGYSLMSLEALFKTTMNNGVKDYDDGLDPFVFTLMGGKIELDVKSDASEEVVEKAFLEAQIMAPSYLALSGSIDINLDIGSW